MLKESKTIFYLNSLKATEKNELTEFVSSPFFNKNLQLIALLEQLLNCKEIDEKSIFKKVTGKKYDEQKFRYLLSDLNLLMEDFLSVKKFNKNALLKKQLLLQGLQEKKIFKYARQHQQDLIQLIENNQKQDAEILGSRLITEELSFRLAADFDNRSLDTRLQKLSDSIDSYYFAKKLKYACEMINRSNVLQDSYNVHFLEEIRNFLKTSSFLQVPAISLYYHILNSLLRPEEEEHYNNLITELKKHKEFFSTEELRDMFTFAQNYCIRRLNAGQVHYLEKLFVNYKYLLEEKIILNNNTISQFDFKNIVTIGLRLNEFEWVKKFISTYSVNLPASDRSNAEVYNLSRLYYSSGEPRKALKLMQNVEFTDVYYHLDAKVLLVKIYFDNGAVESFIPLYTSFGNYLRRNKRVSAYQRLTYLNFLKFTNQLFNYKVFDKGNLQQILTDLNTTENIADINWLKQKTEQLQN